MSPAAERILKMSVRDVIGMTIKFRNINTLRVRRGQVARISGAGLMVTCLDGDPAFVAFSEVLEIVDARRAA
jgi:hypothetical protein